MPKMKTKKSAAKRFSITGTGKLKYSRAGKQKLLGHKTAKRKRRLRQSSIVSDANHKQIKHLLPYL